MTDGVILELMIFICILRFWAHQAFYLHGGWFRISFRPLLLDASIHGVSKLHTP